MSLQIKVKELCGRVTEISVDGEDPTVRELSICVEKSLGFSCGTQRLIFSGKELSNQPDSLLSGYNVADGTTVHLVIRKPKLEVEAQAGAEEFTRVDFTPEEPIQQDYNGYLDMDLDLVFQAFRLAKLLKLTAMLELFEVMAFSMLLPILFPAIFLIFIGVHAISVVRLAWLVPYILLQIFNIAIQFIFFFPANIGVTFVALNVCISICVLLLTLRFVFICKSMNESEIVELRVLQQQQDLGRTRVFL